MNWRSKILRSSLLLAAALTLTACSRPPTVRGLLNDRYPGYDQVLPTATAVSNEPRFDYLPGNILALALAEPRSRTQSALWNNIGIFCPTNVPLSALKPMTRKSTKVVYDLDLSLRRTLLLSKLKTSLQLEPNEVEFLRRISITVDAPKTYSLRAGAPRPRYTDACIDALASRTDLYKLRSVLVGTVTIDFLFKDNVSLVSRLNLLSRINGAIGFGFVRGESYSIVAENVVFGTKVRPVRLKPSSRKPLLISMSRIN